jgi:hypothetical protein
MHFSIQREWVGLPTQPSPFPYALGSKEHWKHDWMDDIPFHPHRSSLLLDFAAWPTQQCGYTVHKMHFPIQRDWVGLPTQPSPFPCALGSMEHWKHDWMDDIPFHPHRSSLFLDFTAWPTQQCGYTAHQMHFSIQREWVGLPTQPSPFPCSLG